MPVGLAVCLSIGGLAFHIAGFSEMFPYSQIILGLSSQDEMLPIDSITTLVPMVLVYTVLFVTTARLSQISLKKSRPAVLRKVSGAKAQNLIGA